MPCRTGLDVISSFRFCLSGNIFISSFLEYSFARYNIFFQNFFPFSTVNIIFHSFLVYNFSFCLLICLRQVSCPGWLRLASNLKSSCLIHLSARIIGMHQPHLVSGLENFCLRNMFSDKMEHPHVLFLFFYYFENPVLFV
jgi:hypothetical protein